MTSSARRGSRLAATGSCCATTAPIPTPEVEVFEFGLGPVVLSKRGPDDRTGRLSCRPAFARTLCGRELDWIEALAS